MIFSAVRKGNGGSHETWNPSNEKNLVNPGNVITFDNIVINIGNGMDPVSGVFTAPVSGVYAFSFSANQLVKESTQHYISEFGSVQVLKGGMVEFYIFEYGDITNSSIYKPINHSWMMSLVQNEKVHLKMDPDADSSLIVHNDPDDWMTVSKKGSKFFAWFNGQLLEKLNLVDATMSTISTDATLNNSFITQHD